MKNKNKLQYFMYYISFQKLHEQLAVCLNVQSESLITHFDSRAEGTYPYSCIFFHFWRGFGRCYV